MTTDSRLKDLEENAMRIAKARLAEKGFQNKDEDNRKVTKDVNEDYKIKDDEKLPELTVTIEMEGQETIVKEVTSLVAVGLISKDDNVEASNIIVGYFNIETTIATVKALRQAEKVMVKQFIDTFGEDAVDEILGMSMEDDPVSGEPTKEGK